MSDHIETLAEERRVLVASIRCRAERLIGYGQLRAICICIMGSTWTAIWDGGSPTWAFAVVLILWLAADLFLHVRSQREASRITEDAGRMS